MEFTIAWFWIIKLTFLLATLFVAYKAAWINKMQNKIWNILFALLLIFAWNMPIKIQPTTNQVNNQMNYQIQQRQMTQLPEKVKNDSFKSKTSNVREDSIMNKEIN